MSLLDRIAARSNGVERRYSADQWLTEYLMPSVFQFGGNSYGYGYGNTGVNINQSWMSQKVAEVTNDLPGYMAALRGCPPAFAAQMVRANVLSQVRFTFRNPPWHSRTPRKTFGTSALGPLERPWTNATTGELVGRMEWHAGLAGNAYVLRQPDRLRVLRPDWVAVVYGSQQEPEDAAHALDGDLIGYVYQNGGIGKSTNKPQTLLPTDVAHWCPVPDPECAGIGMSWLTPAIRDIQADRMVTQHKIQYFKSGATPNLVVKGITAATPEQFQAIVDKLEEGHAGVANAYKTLYLTAGADATVVGSNLAELDLKNVQGASETRISMLSRVHPTILAVAEGLAGSSLNAGNFGMARRIWADSWIYPTLQDLAGSMAPLVRVPSDAELWFDVTDMPILREDAKDAAEIVQIKISSIVSAINGGLDPDSAIAAVDGGDVKLLKHTGMVSVQLQPPGAEPTEPKPAPAIRAKPMDPEHMPEHMPDKPCCDWDPDVEDPDPDDLYEDDDFRAVTPDGAKGAARLKRYWTSGEGLAKWAPTAHPWTALYTHLAKYMAPAKAKRTAAQWFHDVFGIWPGERKGKNPAGPG